MALIYKSADVTPRFNSLMSMVSFTTTESTYLGVKTTSWFMLARVRVEPEPKPDPDVILRGFSSS
eukprot:6187460-Pleurochrysis_carterae.AAC.3